jgi:hypothetical protein
MDRQWSVSLLHIPSLNLPIANQPMKTDNSATAMSFNAVMIAF